MNPDFILSRLRDISKYVTRVSKVTIVSSRNCPNAQCVHKLRLEAMVDRFGELDRSLSAGGILPTDWAAPLVPAQRTQH